MNKQVGIYVDDDIHEASEIEKPASLSGSHNNFSFRRVDDVPDNERVRVNAPELGPQMPQSSAFEEDVTVQEQ